MTGVQTCALPISDDDRIKFVRLALRYVEARHRLGLIDADLEAQFEIGSASWRERGTTSVDAGPLLENRLHKKILG